MDVEQDDVQEIISRLLTAFVWCESKQGSEYWVNVFKNLEIMLVESDDCE